MSKGKRSRIAITTFLVLFLTLFGCSGGQDNNDPRNLLGLIETGAIEFTGGFSVIDVGGVEIPEYIKLPYETTDGRNWHIRLENILRPEGGISWEKRLVRLYLAVGKIDLGRNEGTQFAPHKIVDTTLQNYFGDLFRAYLTELGDSSYQRFELLFEEPSNPVPLEVAEITTPVEQQYRGHIGIQGSLFFRLSNGEWTILAEQAIPIFKTLEGEVWLVNLDELDRREGETTFQVLDLDEACGEGIGEFVKLPHRCVLEEKFLTWLEVREFLRSSLTPENFILLINGENGVETYLREKGLITPG